MLCTITSRALRDVTRLSAASLLLLPAAASAQFTIGDQAGDWDAFGEAVVVGDFNGDGTGDLAVGIPGEDVGSILDAGAVRVYYSGASPGVAANDEAYFNQSSPGIASIASAYEEFGACLSAGDYDCDDYDDLAVGAPGEEVNGLCGAGAVFVLFGSSTGLSGTGSQYLHQDVPGVQGVCEPYDRFGSALESADFDGDHCCDLAIGVPREDIGSIVDAGAVNVLRGDREIGLTGAFDQLWHEDVNGVYGTSSTGDLYGCALAAGDFDGNGLPDLAIGIRYDDLEQLNGATSAQNAGLVSVLYAERHVGLNARSQDLFPPIWPTLDVSTATGAAFGEALAAGDFDGDGYDDLAVGAPNALVTSNWRRGGEVHVFYGERKRGLEFPDKQIWHQDVPGIAGGVEDGDRFGASLTTGRFGFSSIDALVVGVPGEALGSLSDAGVTQIVYWNASAGALGALGSQMWHQDSGGIAETAQSFDRFGEAVTCGDVTGDGVEDLIVGVPGENVSGHPSAGAVHVLRGEVEGGSVVASLDALIHEFVWLLTLGP